MLGIQRFLLNTLTRFKKPEEALGSLNIGMSRRKSPQQISRARPKDLVARNGCGFHCFVVLKPETQQFCLKVGSHLLHFRLVCSE